MSRISTLSAVLCLAPLSAGLLLSGCAAPASNGGGGVLSARGLASNMRPALPPPAGVVAASPKAVERDGEAGVLLPHAAVSERIGAPLSPRAAMAAVTHGSAAPSPAAPALQAPPVLSAAAASPLSADMPPASLGAERPLSSPAPDGEVGAGIRAGQCWAQLVQEPVTRRQTVQLVMADGTTRFQVRPPELRTQNRAVVVKEEAQTYRVEPPKFRQVTEEVKVKDEVRRLVVVPAVYENREESVLVESARVVLESCRASAQRAAGSNVAGRQANCAREVPARYKTVTRRVLLQPETTREEVTPAVFTTVTKWVLDEPARAVPETLPASTRQVPLTEVTRPAQVQEQVVDPVLAPVQVTQHEGMPQLVWRRALCESEALPEVVTSLQRALRTEGLDVGPADGKLGRRTMAALTDYQRREGLAIGLVTFETLESLRVLP